MRMSYHNLSTELHSQAGVPRDFSFYAVPVSLPTTSIVLDHLPLPPAGKYEMSKCQLDGDERFKDINNFKSEQVWVLIFLKVCSPVPMTVMYVCVAITRHTRQLQTFFHSYVSSYVANVRHDKPSTKILPLKLIDKILLSWTNTQLDYWKQI